MPCQTGEGAWQITSACLGLVWLEFAHRISMFSSESACPNRVIPWSPRALCSHETDLDPAVRTTEIAC